MVLVYLAAAGAVVAGLWAGVAWIDHGGYERGVAEMQVKRDRELAKAAADAQERENRVDAALDEAEQRASKAQNLAQFYQSEWEEAARETKRNRRPLAACQPSQTAARAVAAPGEVAGGSPGAGAGQAALPADPGRVVLLWRAVGLYDGAFTGRDGKPLFSASAQYAGAPERADTASPYGLEDLIDAHGRNAGGQSACLRAFDEAVSKVEAAEAAWDRKNGQ